MSKEATSLRIHKVRRSRRFIQIDYTKSDGEEHSLRSPDLPLPAFTKALDAVVPLVCEIIHAPKSYAEGMKAKGLTVSAKGGNEQVTLVAEKHLPETNGPLNIATPLRLLDAPESEGAVGQPLTDEQANLVDEVIEQAKAYVRGDRGQGQLPLEEDKTEEEKDDDAAEDAEQEEAEAGAKA